MRAIFSVGLRFCTAKKAQALLGGKYDIESIESCLHNFRNFNESVLKLHESNSRQKKNRAVSGLDDVNAELLTLNKSITTQLLLLEKFKASLSKLMLVRDDLARRVELANHSRSGDMDVSPELFLDLNTAFPMPTVDYTSGRAEGGPVYQPVLNPQQHMLQDPHSVGGYSRMPPDTIPLSRQRPELSMLSAMRQHMSMHRELLDFNSKYTTPRTMAAPIPTSLPMSMPLGEQAVMLGALDGQEPPPTTAIPTAPLVPSAPTMSGDMYMQGPGPGPGTEVPFSLEENSVPLTVEAPELMCAPANGDIGYGGPNNVMYPTGRPDVTYAPPQPTEGQYNAPVESRPHQYPPPNGDGGSGSAGEDFDLFDFLF